ncbi:uncharacterized protein LTR77_010560 [Saxophila tyrrhenica]|uniref:Uncharacterized protein n=1 Tax=Saxophila tyrrhenica TaxID=1690608 RepID=A0AAV9NXM2_9PEZI|nr:hypothetical protein LTR77_010560 [Saxophila tyrrhenica]
MFSHPPTSPLYNNTNSPTLQATYNDAITEPRSTILSPKTAVMFCLRNFVSLLFFLTNASPIYITLFLFGQIFLARPCVYCSVLLLVLVATLFDFNADWFEPRWQPSTHSITETASSLFSGDATVTELLSETASFAVAAINGTGGSLASAALDGLKRRGGGGNMGPGSTAAQAGSGGVEWLRSLAEKKQFRIPCVDVYVRL